MLTNKILFRREIENFSELPIAGEISNIKTKTNQLPQGKSFDRLQDQVKQLRVAMGLTSLNTDVKKILVTSSIKGEGKTAVSTQLAISLALSGYKVVLIDCDLRNPGVTGLFGKQNEPGINQYLENKVSPKQLPVPTEFSNLWIVTAKHSIANPTDLLIKSQPENLIKELSNDFDFVVIDTPPVNNEIDAYILSEFCDISLFIVKHNFTPKSVLKKLDETLLQKILTNPVIIFNAVKSRGFLKLTKHYGYGYQ